VCSVGSGIGQSYGDVGRRSFISSLAVARFPPQPRFVAERSVSFEKPLWRMSELFYLLLDGAL
jgi:hypothetical protein